MVKRQSGTCGFIPVLKLNRAQRFETSTPALKKPGLEKSNVMPPLYANFGVEKGDDSSPRTDSGQSERKPRKRTFAEVKKVIKAEFETHGYT